MKNPFKPESPLRTPRAVAPPPRYAVLRSRALGMLSMLFLGTKGVLGFPSIGGIEPSAGGPGTVITVSGQRFHRVEQVRVGEIEANFQTLSETEIQLTVPLGAISGVISVATPEGIAVSRNRLAIPPRIESIEPELAGRGSPVVIRGHNFEAATAVRFGGAKSAFTVVSSTQINAVVPPEAPDGVITVEAPAGSGRSFAPFRILGAGPLVTEIRPLIAVPGELVAVTGRQFLSVTNLTVGSLSVFFSVTSDNKVVFEVPLDAADGPVTLESPLGSGSSEASLRIVRDAPIVTGIKPDSARPGDGVVLEGFNLDRITEVIFSPEKAARFDVTAATQILVVVPMDAVSGPVTITSPSGSQTVEEKFVVDSFEPKIASFRPRSGLPGSMITILGSGFLNVTNVSINGVSSLFQVTAETQIAVTVPENVARGPITVSSGLGTAVSPEDFEISTRQPILTAFEPRSGRAGGEIILTGENFKNVEGVFFGELRAQFSVVASTQIRATVPNQVVSAPISVGTAEGTAVSEGLFFVPPKIEALEPPRAVPGQPVELIGANFQQAISVQFNRARAPFSILSATRLVATVPDDARIGSVSVETPAGLVGSSELFEVIPLIESIRPTAGPPGTRLTILGKGFLEVESVEIGGAPAPFTIQGPTVIEAIVPISAVMGKVAVRNPAEVAVSDGVFRVGTPSGEPSGPVRLEIQTETGRQIELTWFDQSGDLKLEETRALGDPSSWREVTDPIVTQGARNVLRIRVEGPSRFFRLRPRTAP